MEINDSVNAAAIAELLGLSSQRVGQLAREGRIPGPDGEGKFQLVKTVRRYCEFLRTRAESVKVVSARRRRLEAQAEVSELQLAERKGDLLDRSAVVRVWQEHITEARQIIQNSSLSPQERRRVLEALAVEDYTKE